MSIINELSATAKKLSEHGKGILAADESTPTITKRFEANGISSTEETRRDYRDMLISTPGFNQFIAGVILFEETLNQKTADGVAFPAKLEKMGVLPGIKVDKGLIDLSNTDGEKVAQGLDGLADRLQDYKSKGAKFAKWRCVYNISSTTPSTLAIHANAEVLARYAAICQDNGIVPIVEPEVLIDGEHTIEQCEAISEPVFQAVFEALHRYKVKLEYIVLKPSMIISGKKCSKQAGVKEVAEATMRILKRTVPAAVPSINFLSGGQTSEQATAHLNTMNAQGPLPWNLSFSYARALQEYAMATWKGESNNVEAAQNAFYKRAKLNSLAATGQFKDSMEKEDISMVA